MRDSQKKAVIKLGSHCKFSSLFELVMESEPDSTPREGLNIVKCPFKPWTRKKVYIRGDLEDFCSRALLQNIEVLSLVEALHCLNDLLTERSVGSIENCSFPIFSVYSEHRGYVVCRLMSSNDGCFDLDIDTLPQDGDVYIMNEIKK